MSRLPERTPREKRNWWLSLAGLVVMLPLALMMRSYENAIAWYQGQELEPTVVTSGGTASYGGAEWRLGGLYKLQSPGSSAAIILAEFEAIVSDPAAFTGGPCSVALTDAAGRRWRPVFLMPQAIRKARPEVSDKPTCNTARLGPAAAGQRVVMAEAFTAPSDVVDFDLVISFAGHRPAYLVLK
jgi:hypothetical protein